jgi:hypothetical protein
LSISFKNQLRRYLSLYNPLSYSLIFKANFIAFIIALISLGNRGGILLAYIKYI